MPVPRRTRESRERSSRCRGRSGEVHEDEREPGLSAVAAAAQSGDRAPRRGEEERAVIRLAVVVTSETEAQRHPDHEERIRERHVQSPALEIRGVERREVSRTRPRIDVVRSHRRNHDRIDPERGQASAGQERRQPPAVLPSGLAESVRGDGSRSQSEHNLAVTSSFVGKIVLITGSTQGMRSGASARIRKRLPSLALPRRPARGTAD